MTSPDPPESDFERHLRSVSPRPLPEDWKAGILANATAAPSPAATGWWDRAPKKTIFALAACWVAILGLRVTTPKPEALAKSPPDTSVEAPALLAGWIAQREALLQYP